MVDLPPTGVIGRQVPVEKRTLRYAAVRGSFRHLQPRAINNVRVRGHSTTTSATRLP